MFKYSISTLLLLSSFFLYAQDLTTTSSNLEADYLDQSHVEYAFEGGYEGYQNYIKEKIEFPKISYQDQIEGLLLFYFTVDSEKNKVEVTFLTKLDDRIEDNVRAAFEGSASKWKFAEPGKHTFYQPIVYSLLPYYSDNLEGDLPELPNALPLKFLQVFVKIKSKRIPKDFDIKNATDDEISEKAKTMYVRTQAAYDKALASENYQVAYTLLNKLIRYNPLEKQFLYKRIELEKKVEVREFQAYDAMLLNDFMATYEKLDSYESVGASLGSSPVVPYEYEKMDYDLAYEDSYLGGYRAFMQDMARMFMFPNLSYIQKEEGVALLEVKSDESGNINASYLTNFDNPLQKGLENALKIMSLNWKVANEPVHFIQPFYFSQSETIAMDFAKTMRSFHLQSDSLFITPLEYSGMASAPMMDMVFNQDELSEDEKRKNATYRSYMSSKKEFDKYMRLENTKKAAKALHEMIKLNPYDIELIKTRLSLDDKKSKSKFKAYDLRLLEVLNQLESEKSN